MDSASALLRPRHLLFTFLVALSTGTVGIAVTATTGDETSAPPPDQWTVPFTTPGPNVGDKGTYVDVSAHDKRDDGYWPKEVGFEWLPDGIGYASDASRHVANRLLLDWKATSPRY